MGRYIDADALIKEAEKESNQDGAYGYMDTKSIVDLINDAPTADVVEVVRCKDCKHYKPGKHFDDIPFCYRLKGKDGEPVGYNFSPEDFCSYGEMRDDGK